MLNETDSDKINPLEKLSASATPEVYVREHPPTHYSFKIYSFTLLQQSNVEKYESGLFKAEGFKWRLSLYPNGDKKRGGADHLSLYLAIQRSGNHMTHGWEVNAIIKLFVFDQIRNSYLTVQHYKGGVSRFHQQKMELGFSKLISLNTFKKTSNGYLVGNACVFGAEIFVVKPSAQWESLAMVKIPKPIDNTHTWKIKNFSKHHNDKFISQPFTIGNHQWILQLYPNGYNEQKGKYLSIYLKLVGADKLPGKRKIYAAYKLRVVDQLHQHHQELSPTDGHWFDSKSVSNGYRTFMKLKDFRNKNKGFIHKDLVKVEVEIPITSVVKVHV